MPLKKWVNDGKILPIKGDIKNLSLLLHSIFFILFLINGMVFMISFFLWGLFERLLNGLKQNTSCLKLWWKGFFLVIFNIWWISNEICKIISHKFLSLLSLSRSSKRRIETKCNKKVVVYRKVLLKLCLYISVLSTGRNLFIAAALSE